MTQREIIARGARIILRRSTPADADTFARWQSEGEWREYDAPWETLRELTEEQKTAIRGRFIKRCREVGDGALASAIIVTTEEKPLGWVNRYGSERFSRACLVGISIAEDGYLNKGLGTESLRLWVGYQFENSDVHRIGLDTWSLNPRMARVAEKIGFTLEGRERELVRWRGKWLDRIHYGLLRSEWERCEVGVNR